MVSRYSVMLAAALGLAIPAAVTARQPVVAAQFGNVLQSAYNEGYQRGQRAGIDDSRRGRAYNVTSQQDYRQGDAGYRGEYGSRDRYREEFRRGFEAGYRAGYGRTGNAGRGIGRGPVPPPWARGRANGTIDRPIFRRYDLAAQYGYNDGYEAGLKDAQKRQQFDPISEGRYRSADRGYEREYGSKELYKTNYRDSFRDGYADGYDDGWRYATR